MTLKYVSSLFELFRDHPLLLLTVLLAFGAAIGHPRVAGVRLGPAAVLFAALAMSALGVSAGVDLEIPEVVGTFGLILFTYTIGVVAGPRFFASLRHGWRTMLSLVLVLVALAGLALLGGRLLGLSGPVSAGVFAGALTNTPALAAATGTSGDAVGPTIGYSISYLGGVLLMLGATAICLRRASDEPQGPSLSHLTIRVEVDEHPTFADLTHRYGRAVTFSRVRHTVDTNPTQVAADEDSISRDDLITAVGPVALLERVASDLGHVSSHNIVADRRDLDFRRITLSNKSLAGRTIAASGIERRFGAQVTRVRRGDLDFVGTDDFVLQMGDRLRVIAPTARMPEISRHIGDSDRGMSDINVGGLALGLAVGLLVGLVHIPLPGGGFAIGAAAGTLLVGLVFGRVGRVGPVITSMSHGAAQSLSLLGMVTFLAYAGVRAGQQITSALTSDVGWRVLLLGLVITAAAAVILVAVTRFVHRMDGVTIAGTLAGAQTQPAVLAFANDRTGFDPRIGVAYALVYPAAMIAKILLAQVIAGL